MPVAAVLYPVNLVLEGRRCVVVGGGAVAARKVEGLVAAGAEVLHAPREFPEYHPGYYGVFLRDPDGHNVEAVHHG